VHAFRAASRHIGMPPGPSKRRQMGTRTSGSLRPNARR
jgi:hypothetical protein